MKKVVMAVFAHADDAAWMCGGTVAKFAAEGWKLMILSDRKLLG